MSERQGIPRCLTIAGSDSGGGAGIQADLKTFHTLGCFGTSAITALTAQNTVGVQGVLPIEAAFVQAQIRSVLDDIGTDAVKIGMLHNSAVIETVAEAIVPLGTLDIPVVLDPVMVATSGDLLLETEAVDALRSRLAPLATVITPNMPEAEVLLGEALPLDRAASELVARGIARAALVKGGHGDGDASIDVLATTDGLHTFEAPRIDTNNTHGTGCTLSSAIAAFLARGHALQEAVDAAKSFLTAALQHGASDQLGNGHGPAGSSLYRA